MFLFTSIPDTFIRNFTQHRNWELEFFLQRRIYFRFQISERDSYDKNTHSKAEQKE